MVVFATNGAVEPVPRRVDPGAAGAQTAHRSADEGFAECYAASFKGLVTQLYAYTGDLSLAHDLVQEAFCRALPRWSKLASYDDPVAWVRRVAMNLAKNRWRRARVALLHARRQRPAYVDGPGPDRVAALAALAALPDNHRRALVLHYLADMTVADVAAHEGVPVGTVKAWLHRGRHALASMLGEEAANA
jgi:RNA polymerase sigma-70 factor (ECF subfamily)